MIDRLAQLVSRNDTVSLDCVQSLRSLAKEPGELHVALTDSADNFLNVARDALQLDFGKTELQPLL